jgi:hypothetical protein
MAANFNINFTDNLQFTFTDLSDYTDLTVTKSDLLVNYPNDFLSTPITLDLYDENINSLGDNYDFVIADEELLSSLTTGVYKFTLNLLNGETVVSTKTIYVINAYDIQVCLRRKTDLIMDKQCSDEWCEIGLVGTLLDVAIRESQENRYSQAQEIMDYLISKCNEC